MLRPAGRLCRKVTKQGSTIWYVCQGINSTVTRARDEGWRDCCVFVGGVHGVRLLAIAGLMTAGTVITACACEATEVPDSCPVTKPSQPGFHPPAPYPSDGSFWIGSPALWTRIPADGTWNGLGHYSPEYPNFRQKLFWWSEGYHWRLSGKSRSLSPGTATAAGPASG